MSDNNDTTPEDLESDKPVAEEPAFGDAEGEVTDVTALEPGEEIAARTADTEETSTDVFTKTFLLGLEQSPSAADYSHDANKAGTVNEAVQRGLRPTSETVTVKSSKKVVNDEGDLVGYAVTYTVPVELATSDSPSIRIAEDGAEVPAKADDE